MCRPAAGLSADLWWELSIDGLSYSGYCGWCSTTCSKASNDDCLKMFWLNAGADGHPHHVTPTSVIIWKFVITNHNPQV